MESSTVLIVALLVVFAIYFLEYLKPDGNSDNTTNTCDCNKLDVNGNSTNKSSTTTTTNTVGVTAEDLGIIKEPGDIDVEVQEKSKHTE